jgi:flagellar biosynthesis/type III secretory pathway protein FliH
VIKATEASAVNPFRMGGLSDFATGTVQLKQHSPQAEVLVAGLDEPGRPEFSTGVGRVTGKVTGTLKDTSHLPIRSWAVSEFHRESPVKTTGNQPSAQTQSVTVEDHSYLIEEAKSQADAIIAEAEKNAEAIMAQARTEAEGLKQSAFSEGMSAARSEMSQTLHQVERLFQETQLWQEQVMRQSQTRIIEMVMAIGKKLFSSGFELPAEQIDHIVSRAINEASRLGNLRVYLHPEDAKLLVNLWQESELTLNGQQIQIVSSQNISRGGCFIDGEFGVLDGRVEEQFDQINKSIKSTEGNLEVEE